MVPILKSLNLKVVGQRVLDTKSGDVAAEALITSREVLSYDVM